MKPVNKYLSIINNWPILIFLGTIQNIWNTYQWVEAAINKEDMPTLASYNLDLNALLYTISIVVFVLMLRRFAIMKRDFEQFILCQKIVSQFRVLKQYQSGWTGNEEFIGERIVNPQLEQEMVFLTKRLVEIKDDKSTKEINGIVTKFYEFN